MLKDRIEDSLTFDDVLLLPGYSKLLPSEVSVKSRITQTLECNIPLISAAMDTVTEHQTAICMAQQAYGKAMLTISSLPKKPRIIQ